MKSLAHRFEKVCVEWYRSKWHWAGVRGLGLMTIYDLAGHSEFYMPLTIGSYADKGSVSCAKHKTTVNSIAFWLVNSIIAKSACTWIGWGRSSRDWARDFWPTHELLQEGGIWVFRETCMIALRDDVTLSEIARSISTCKPFPFDVHVADWKSLLKFMSFFTSSLSLTYRRKCSLWVV